MSSETLKQIEQEIENAKIIVELSDSLERLSNNRDFKKIVLENYFREEAVRLVHLKGNPAMQKEEHQKAILSSMDAISALRQYFQTIEQQANQARRSILGAEETRDELLAEELGQ